MTVSTTVNKVIASGNGVTTVFNFAFPILASADLVVIYTDSTGVETTLSSGVYTTTGIGATSSGGTVTYPLSGSPIATGTKLTIMRVMALRQGTSITSQANFDPAVLEGGLDNEMLVMQQVDERANRSLRGPAGEAALTELVGVAARANKFLAFDASGNPMAISGSPFTPVVTSVITQAATGQFFTQNGAIINRINDRLFVGPATVNDGAFPNVIKDWLSQHAATYGGIGLVSTQAAILSQNGNTALTVSSRTTDANPGSSSCIALSVAGVNNAATPNGAVCWGSYYETSHHVTALLSYCSEMDIIQYDTAFANTPNSMAGAGSAICLWLASGGGRVGVNDATLAIGIIKNGAKFKSGIMFGKDSLTGADGTTGTGEAIAMAKGHQLNWYNASGSLCASFYSTVATAGNINTLTMTDAGFNIAAPAVQFNGGGLGALIGIRVFANAAASGVYTPTTGTTSIEVEIRAAGGGGGGISNAAGSLTAAGGGEGGRAIKRITSAFSGVTVTVGAGGLAGDNTGSNGSTGSTTSFGALVTATGGTGGSGATSVATRPPGTGGSGASGDMNYRGSVGQPNISGSTVSGAGGGEGGGGTRSSASNAAGIAGLNGGGGGGAGGNSSTGFAGGAGGDGWVIIREYM